MAVSISRVVKVPEYLRKRQEAAVRGPELPSFTSSTRPQWMTRGCYWWHPRDSEPRILRSMFSLLASPEKYKKWYSHWEKTSGMFSTSLAHTWFDRGFLRQFTEAGGISHIFYVKEDSVFEPCVSGSPRLVSSLPEEYSYFGLSGRRLREVFPYLAALFTADAVHTSLMSQCTQLSPNFTQLLHERGLGETALYILSTCPLSPAVTFSVTVTPEDYRRFRGSETS